MAASSLALNPEALLSSAYAYSSSSLAGYAPSFPAATSQDDGDFSAELDDHRYPFEFDYSQPAAPIVSGAGDDERSANTTRCESDDFGKRAKVTSGRIGSRTRSQVEILDDGFKWRKYGKKAVKNLANV